MKKTIILILLLLLSLITSSCSLNKNEIINNNESNEIITSNEIKKFNENNSNLDLSFKSINKVSRIISINNTIENYSNTYINIIPSLEEHYYDKEWSILKIRFFSMELNESDFKNISLDFFDNLHSKKSTYYKYNTAFHNTTIYNKYLEIIFNIDSSYNVGQIDITMPGYACTIAYTQEDIDTFLEDFKLTSNTLKLISKGTMACPNTMDHVNFTWDLNIRTKVFNFR